MIRIPAVAALALAAFAETAATCGDGGGCGPWHQRLDEATVGLVSGIAVAALVLTCAGVLILRRRPRVHRALSVLLALQVFAVLGAGAALAT